MRKIDLTKDNDGRYVDFDRYGKDNARLRTFSGSVIDETKKDGDNTWSHLGVYCGQMFDKDLTKQERRLIYLGLLTAYVNGDRCAHWTEEERDAALKTAWDFISKNRDS